MKSKTTLYVLGAILAIGTALFLAGCDFFSSGSSSSGTSTTQEPPGLPPDPGPAGKETLAGVDSNNNGVRDDVERYIAINHQDSAKVRAALMQFAVVAQSRLLDATDKQKSIQHGIESGKAIECIIYVLGNDLVAVDMSDSMRRDLRPIILNTDARNKAYFAYDKQLGGQYFPGTPNSEIASACTFDPNTLPN